MGYVVTAVLGVWFGLCLAALLQANKEVWLDGAATHLPWMHRCVLDNNDAASTQCGQRDTTEERRKTKGTRHSG